MLGEYRVLHLFERTDVAKLTNGASGKCQRHQPDAGLTHPGWQLGRQKLGAHAAHDRGRKQRRADRDASQRARYGQRLVAVARQRTGEPPASTARPIEVAQRKQGEDQDESDGNRLAYLVPSFRTMIRSRSTTTRTCCGLTAVSSQEGR